MFFAPVANVSQEQGGRRGVVNHQRKSVYHSLSRPILGESYVRSPSSDSHHVQHRAALLLGNTDVYGAAVLLFYRIDSTTSGSLGVGRCHVFRRWVAAGVEDCELVFQQARDARVSGAGEPESDGHPGLPSDRQESHGPWHGELEWRFALLRNRYAIPFAL